MRKVPEITLVFWIIKILTTGMGETSSDFLATHFNPAIVVATTGLLLVLCVWFQIVGKTFRLWLYWLTIIMVSIFGTMAADILHVVLGIPYLVSTLGYAGLLALLFLVWYITEHDLSIHSINSRRREIYYWLVVFTTFALGTAGGDMTATTLGWGYWWSGVLFFIAFAVPFGATMAKRGPEVLTFWLAYIITRPLGASFADWAGVTPHRGGLGWGTGPVSLTLFLAVVVLVAGLSVRERYRKRALALK